MKLLYKILIGLGILALPVIAYGASVFNSQQTGNSATGCVGCVLQTNGGNPGVSTYVATSTLGIVGGGSSATTTINGLSTTNYTFTGSGVTIATSAPGTISFTVTGGSGTISTSTNAQIGKVAAWTGLATLGNGALFDNGTVAGVNATSSTISLNVQGNAGAFDPFNVASSSGTSLFVVKQSGNVGIGLTSPNTKLEVAGTASSTGLQVNGNGTITNGALLVTSSNGFGGNIIDAQSFGGSSRFSVDTSGNVTAGNTLSVPTVQGNSSDLLVRSNGAVSGAGSVGISLTNQNTLTFTSGTANTVKILGNFSPTSGTAAYRSLEIASTVNQTGGANGVTRGMYVNNTVTAAADYRALETATGTVLFLNGNVGIATTSPASKLHVAYDATSTASTLHTLQLGTLALSSPSANGTYFGLNAPASFTGDFLRFQLNGTNEAILTNAGALTVASLTTGGAGITMNGTPTITNGNVNAGLSIVSNTGSNGGNVIQLQLSGSENPTSGTTNFVTINGRSTPQFNPTSGTAVANMLSVGDGSGIAINQTGTANGISRGIYINPTITKAADYRDLEVAAYTKNLAAGYAGGTIYGSLFNPYTVASSSAGTIANAQMLTIGGAPIAGSNITLSSSSALTILSNNVTASTTAAYGAYINAPSGATNNYALGVNGHITYTGATPTISSCGATPNGSATGNDSRFTITIGGGVVTACTATFATPFKNTPVCALTDNSAGISVAITSASNSAITITSSAALGGGIVYVHCDDWQ